LSVPIFIHIMSTGDVWVSTNVADTPAGTSIGIFKVNSDSKFQKIGTLTGTTSSNLAASGTTGKQGKEIS
jgi:hypothetical protein